MLVAPYQMIITKSQANDGFQSTQASSRRRLNERAGEQPREGDLPEVLTSCTSRATSSFSFATSAASLASSFETWLIEGGGGGISMILSTRIASSCSDVSARVDARTIWTVLSKRCRKSSLRNVKVVALGAD